MYSTPDRQLRSTSVSASVVLTAQNFALEPDI